MVTQDHTSTDRLFVDDAEIAHCTNVIRQTHACQKQSAPVLTATAPWESTGEDRRIYIYGTVLYDGDLFRMWYMRYPDQVLYATSEDGMHWDRPHVNLVDFNGSKSNNILPIACHSPSAFSSGQSHGSRRHVSSVTKNELTASPPVCSMSTCPHSGRMTCVAISLVHSRRYRRYMSQMCQAPFFQRPQAPFHLSMLDVRAARACASPGAPTGRWSRHAPRRRTDRPGRRRWRLLPHPRGA